MPWSLAGVRQLCILVKLWYYQSIVEVWLSCTVTDSVCCFLHAIVSHHRDLWLDTHTADIISQWQNDWKLASLVNSALVHDPTNHRVIGQELFIEFYCVKINNKLHAMCSCRTKASAYIILKNWTEAEKTASSVSELDSWTHDVMTVSGCDIVTFCVSRRRRKMYCGHARLSVCLCVCPRPYAHTTARTRM